MAQETMNVRIMASKRNKYSTIIRACVTARDAADDADDAELFDMFDHAMAIAINKWDRIAESK